MRCLLVEAVLLPANTEQCSQSSLLWCRGECFFRLLFSLSTQRVYWYNKNSGDGGHPTASMERLECCEPNVTPLESTHFYSKHPTFPEVVVFCIKVWMPATASINSKGLQSGRAPLCTVFSYTLILCPDLNIERQSRTCAEARGGAKGRNYLSRRILLQCL